MTIYSLVGHSIQQIGGECPDGWTEMECERPSNVHVATSEGKWVVRELTYAEALKELNTQFYSDRAALSADLNNVQLLGGEHLDSLTAALQKDYVDLLAQYDADVAALKSQYGES